MLESLNLLFDPRGSQWDGIQNVRQSALLVVSPNDAIVTKTRKLYFQ
jgi:hypothetical protein